MEYREYRKPGSLPEATQFLQEAQSPVLLLAGGTDVMVYARADNRFQNHTVVDIYGLAELGAIRDEGDWLSIGAGATHSAIEQNALVQAHAPVLAKASASVGSLQIRNHATLGGNIANASPAADTFAALAVLEAEVEVLSAGQTKRLPLAQVVTGPYKTNLGERDLITQVLVRKLPAGSRSGFIKLGRRKALAISRLTVAAVLQQDAQGLVRHFCIAVGAAFPTPLFFADVNALMLGQRPSAEVVEAVAAAMADKIPEVTGLRPSTAYKQPVTRNLCRRLLKEMLEGEE